MYVYVCIMYVYVCIIMYTHPHHIQMHTIYTHIYLFGCLRVWKTQIHKYTYTHIHTHTYTLIHTHTHTNTDMCIDKYMVMYTHTPVWLSACVEYT